MECKYTEKQLKEFCDYWKEILISKEKPNEKKVHNAANLLYGKLFFCGKQRKKPRIIAANSPNQLVRRVVREEGMNEDCSFRRRKEHRLCSWTIFNSIMPHPSLGEGLFNEYHIDFGARDRNHKLKRELQSAIRQYLGNIADTLFFTMDSMLSDAIANVSDDVWGRFPLSGNSLGCFSSSFPHLLAEKFAHSIAGVPYYGKKHKAVITAWITIAENCAFGWAYERRLYVLRRPEKIKIANNNIHCDGAEAVRWRTGQKVYMLNGVLVPKKVACLPAKSLKASMITNTRNAEVRREVVRKMGIKRVLKKLKAKTISRQGNYELLLVNVQNRWMQNRLCLYLKMTNPSTGTYHIEGVHPNCRTVKEALKWRNGTTEDPMLLT